jgi:hypothetical protein
MNDFIANDFASIGAGLKALEAANRSPETVTLECNRCEGGGWECYGLGFGDPHFRECTACGNPEGHPSP